MFFHKKQKTSLASICSPEYIVVSFLILNLVLLSTHNRKYVKPARCGQTANGHVISFPAALSKASVPDDTLVSKSIQEQVDGIHPVVVDVLEEEQIVDGAMPDVNEKLTLVVAESSPCPLASASVGVTVAKLPI